MSDNTILEKEPTVGVEIVAEDASILQVAQMDQRPSQAARAESPLYHADLETVASKGLQKGGVVIQELKLLDHLVIRGKRDNTLFMKVAEEVLGVALPSALQTSVNGDKSISWISPDEWLVVAPGGEGFDLEAQFRSKMSGHYAIVNVSGAQTILSISGPDAVKMLKKSTPYDLHDRHFPVGKTVTTVFAKSQIVISRKAENNWELVVRRSFADYLWCWIQDASKEYGLTIKS